MSGDGTLVMAEGRRMMRLRRELPPDEFERLLQEYAALLGRVFEEWGGRGVDIAADTATATFATARAAVLAAVAVQRAVADHAWPHGQAVSVSLGIDSGGSAACCADLCDAAEGRQTFVSAATAALLQGEDLSGVVLRDLGDRRTRREGRAVRAYELLFSSYSP